VCIFGGGGGGGPGGRVRREYKKVLNRRYMKRW
jgi:hypothetical protein